MICFLRVTSLTRHDVTDQRLLSEYVVTGKDAGTGSLLAALGEAAFLIGLEKNSDAVEMASYAPLFVNTNEGNDRRWNPDATVYDSANSYGTRSYWMQQFFTKSSGAALLKTTLQTSSSSLVASAISWKNSTDNTNCITIKVVNFGNKYVNLKLSIGVDQNIVRWVKEDRSYLF